MESILLSIDLDYFIREDPMWDFGHIEDNMFMSSWLWKAARYSMIDLYKETDIRTYADCLPAEFPKVLSDLGFKFSRDTKIGAGWSHKDAYNFFRGFKAKTLLNFDAHHDYGYGEKSIDTARDEIDCGNWLRKLCDEEDIVPVWVVPDWLDERQKVPISKTSLDEIPYKERQVEAIYIAQSPAWVPPHHDIQYHILLEVLFRACKRRGKKVDADYQFVRRESTSMEEARGLFNEHQKVWKEFQERTANGTV